MRTTSNRASLGVESALADEEENERDWRQVAYEL
jgi:hypothetical protein